MAKILALASHVHAGIFHIINASTLSAIASLDSHFVTIHAFLQLSLDKIATQPKNAKPSINFPSAAKVKKFAFVKSHLLKALRHVEAK